MLGHAPSYKTRAELTLERIESLKRPLTDEESDQLRRSMHAVYCRNRLARIRADELRLLAKVEAEAEQTDPHFARPSAADEEFAAKVAECGRRG